MKRGLRAVVGACGLLVIAGIIIGYVELIVVIIPLGIVLSSPVIRFRKSMKPT